MIGLVAAVLAAVLVGLGLYRLVQRPGPEPVGLFTGGDPLPISDSVVDAAEVRKRLDRDLAKVEKVASGLKNVPEDMQRLDEIIRDMYFCNFSVFQSLPDLWAIDSGDDGPPLEFIIEKGEVDFEGLEKNVRFQIENGANLVPTGTTGESPTLTNEEHDQVIELTVKFARGRVPVMAGTGSNSTAEAIERTKHAEHAGAAAALQVCPYYNRPTQDGILAHFEAVAKATKLPLFIYNIPSRTGRLIEAKTMTTRFDGFPPETLKFLRRLRKNNNREWFQANKQAYELHVKAPMLEMVTMLGNALQAFAPEMVIDPKNPDVFSRAPSATMAMSRAPIRAAMLSA
jgi:hypothetical protein